MKLSLSPEELLTLSLKYKWQILFILVGTFLLLGGVFVSKLSDVFVGDKVEVLGDSTTNNSEESLTKKEIIVEISGEVENPGVYKLEDGSRVNDLLIASGGLSSGANRIWVEKNINKAAKLVDGQKLYIPKEGEEISQSSAVFDSQTGSKSGGGVGVTGLININEADQKTLESLNGIGQTYASNIIAHRRYSTIEEIVSKAGVPQKTFEKIKSQISVY